jgi:hypothetical protein
VITLGAFGPFWFYYQYSYLKKINPLSNKLTIWFWIAEVFYILLIVALTRALFNGADMPSSGLVWVFIGIAAVQMGSTVDEAYRQNGVTRKPLNKWLSFLINLCYLQHHLTQIAKIQKQPAIVFGRQSPYRAA